MWEGGSHLCKSLYPSCGCSVAWGQGRTHTHTPTYNTAVLPAATRACPIRLYWYQNNPCSLASSSFKVCVCACVSSIRSSTHRQPVEELVMRPGQQLYLETRSRLLVRRLCETWAYQRRVSTLVSVFFLSFNSSFIFPCLGIRSIVWHKHILNNCNRFYFLSCKCHLTPFGFTTRQFCVSFDIKQIKGLLSCSQQLTWQAFLSTMFNKPINMQVLHICIYQNAQLIPPNNT